MRNALGNHAITAEHIADIRDVRVYAYVVGNTDGDGHVGSPAMIKRIDGVRNAVRRA